MYIKDGTGGSRRAGRHRQSPTRIERLQDLCGPAGGQDGEFEHKLEHDRLTKQVREFQRSFQAGRSSVTIPLMTFLKDWLTKHIMTEDEKYIVCVSN